MSRQFVHRVLQAAAFAAMLATAWPAAHAQNNVTWTGTSSTSWSDNLNWLGNTVPGLNDSLFFTQGNPTFSPSNAPTSGTYRSLNFLNSTFTGPLTLGGAELTLSPAIAGGTTINNANTTAGRNVTIGNNLVLSGSQNWVAASSTNAITIISGNLSGSGTVRIAAGSASNTLPNFRLTGANSSYSGTINFASNLGLLLGSPSAMTGGLVNINGANLWLTGNTSGSPYTFGIDGPQTSGARVGFGSTAGFLNAAGGDVYWQPSGTTNYNWTGTSGTTIRFGGSDGTTPRVFYLGTTGGTFSISGTNKSFAVANSGIAPGRVTLLSSLGGGDATARTLTTDLPVLTLTAAASDSNPSTPLNVTLSIGLAGIGAGLEISNQNQLPGGNLNLGSYGTLILKDGASFTRVSGAGNNGYQLSTSASAGFAASGNAPATIANQATSTGSSAFNQNFGIGFSLRNPDGTLYANQALTIAQNTNLTVTSTVTVAMNGIEYDGTGDTRLNRFSGNLTGVGALVVNTTHDTVNGFAHGNSQRQGVLVLSGTNDWTGAPTAQFQGSGPWMNVGPGGLIARRGYVLFDGTSSIPYNSTTSGTSFISAQSNAGNHPSGLLLGGGASEVVYDLPDSRRFLLGSNNSGLTTNDAASVAFGADGGKARVEGSTMLLNFSTSSGTGAFRLLVINGAELALGGTGKPFDLIPTSGTSATGSSTPTPYIDATGGRQLVKQGEGTLVLSNVRYIDLAGTGTSQINQFTWQIGRYTATNTQNTAATFDGAVRGLSLSNTAANSSNSLAGLSMPILMRGGVYEIDNSDNNNGIMTATTGTGAGSTFDFARNTNNGSGGFSAFGGDVAVTLNSNSTLVSTGDGVGTLGWLNNTGPLMFGSQTANARIELTNPLSARGLRVLVVDNPASALDFALLSGVFSDQSSSNANPLTKLGAGLLELSAANTFTGTTTVSAGTLRLANNQALQNSPLSTTGTGVVALTGVVTSPTFGGLVGTTDLSSVITTGLGNISSLTLNVSGSRSYTGAISGTFGVTKTGAGSQTLGGNNSYTGPTTLSTGTLRLGVGSSMTGAIANAGVLQLFQGGATTGTASGLISGTGSLTVDGGVVQLSNPASTYTGSTTILSGVLEAVSIANSGTANFSALGAPASGTATITIGSTTTSGTLRYVGSGASSSNRPFSLAGNGAIEASGGGALTLTGSVSGTGSRTLTLAGTNTDLNTIGTISGTGVSVVKDGVGQWVLTGTGSPGGTLTINQGTLRVNDFRAIPSTVTIGGTYATGTAAFILGAGQTSSVQLDVLAGTQQVLIGGDAGAIQTGEIRMSRGITLVATTGGTAEFRGSWAGATTESPADQNVRIGAAGYEGSVLLGGLFKTWSTSGTVSVELGRAVMGTFATIDPTTPLTIGSSLGSATLDLNSTTQSFRNLSFLSGSGSIVSGVLGIGDGNGAVTVNVTGSNHLISSAVSLNDAATFNVNAASRLNVSSQVSGAGQNLTKTGLGILELSGSNSYDGATTVSAGGLLVNGRLESSVVTVEAGGLLGGSGYLGDVTVLAGGTFSPGNSPGLINVANLNLAGTTLMELEGLIRGTEYDAANVTSTLTYGGAMVIDFGSFANTALPDNTSFNLFDFGSYTGLFSGITTSSNASWYAGLTFSGTGDKRTATVGAQTLEFTHSTGILLVVPEPATIALAGIAAACAGFVAYRRRRLKA